MNFKDITSSISETEKIPAGKVRKITKAFLDRLIEAINNSEDLKLPGIMFNPKTWEAQEAKDDKPALPERKIAVLRVRPAKDEQSSTEETY